jgi:hypothetical protein
MTVTTLIGDAGEVKCQNIFYTSASNEEIEFLVNNFHYSKRTPANIQYAFAARSSGGLFGDYGEILACAVFCIPPTRWSEEVVELSRLVRVPDYAIPLTKLLSFSIKWLRKTKFDLIVSFADFTQKHHGGIYQAASWNYDGCRENRMDGILMNGKFIAGRSCNSKYGTQSPNKLRIRFPDLTIEPHYDEGKHLYWKNLSKSGTAKAKRLGLRINPYPKPAKSSCPDPKNVPQDHTT